MDDALIDYALARIVDDTRIGEWANQEVAQRLGSSDPETDQFWPVYTTVINELIEAMRIKNRPSGE
jgi:hypothetical protein